MNLVIDDAVEVAQITKTNDKETRRSLGTRAERDILVPGLLTQVQARFC